MQSPLNHYEPLYLKYRPQSLGELIGQEGVTRTLTNAINHNRLAHAYLFTGPRGTGKTSSARILAKSLNCKTAGKPTVEPCQTCSCCEGITVGNSPAVFEIDAASNNSVDDARVLIERAPLVAVGGEFKVYIIDECHMLSKEAFNALLKTIEQPPAGVVFILATTEEHKVLPTIVSRCQRLMFKLIPQEPLITHLRQVADKEQIEIEEDALRLIARRSAGGLRDALGSLDQAGLLSAPGKPVTVNDLLGLFGALHEDVLLDISKYVLLRDGEQLISALHRITVDGREPAVIAQELSRHFLNILKASYLKTVQNAEQAGGEGLIVGSQQYIAKLFELAPQFERAELGQIVEAVERLEQGCRRTTRPAMHLEVGLLSICHRHDMLLISELNERVAQLESALSQGQPLPVQAARPAVAPTPAKTPAAAPTPLPQPQIAPPAPVIANAPPPPVSEPEPEEISVVQIAEPEPVVETVAAPVRATGNDTDIEYLWSQILDELQRRHLPTYSLASTHAFPLNLAGDELVLGVLKENFQKMLEQKIEYLKAAAQVVASNAINIRVKVAAESAPAKAERPAANLASASLLKPAAVAPASTPTPERSGSEPVSRVIEPLPVGQTNNEEVDSTLLKEAYKLFDGPGSRRIQ
ncbi:MAG: DNA polymerase III subunit gamma/tau [Candidatus Obscuribacterales bacterium]|nr:DNA polymerase III subunit gamma/tau [Candidatus Obscuribacterales bacterium]